MSDLSKEIAAHPLVITNGGIMHAASPVFAAETDLDLCVQHLYEGLDVFTSNNEEYGRDTRLFILGGGGFNAFVLPIARRLCVFITLGLVQCVLRASYVAVSRSELATLIEGAGNTRFSVKMAPADASALYTFGLGGPAPDCSRPNAALGLVVATTILDFVLFHELMHIGLGHMAYVWKTSGRAEWLEFGNTGMEQPERLLRTSFEAHADAMSAIVGVSFATGDRYGFTDVAGTTKDQVLLWSFGVILACSLLWRMANCASEHADNRTILFDDLAIHPDPIKRRFFIEAHISLHGSPQNPEDVERNDLVRACFNHSVSLVSEAVKGTLLTCTVDPKAFLKEFAELSGLHRPSLRERLSSFLRARPRPKLMVDPMDWITSMHELNSSSRDAVHQAQAEFDARFLRR